MIKLIIFDWDDVFSQGSTRGYFKCYHEAIKGVGVELDPEEEKKRIVSKWGADHREEIAALLREQPELVDEASDLYEKHLFGDTFVDCLTVTPGGVELVKRLAGKYKLAIASGVHPKLLKERIMPKFGMPDVFSKIMTAYDLDDPAKAKPHPHIAETIMQELGCKPEETIMVGDAPNDVGMARSAGIEPVVVLSGYLSRMQAEQLAVKYIIPDVTHLEEVLEILNQSP